jgi:aminopeptidase N
MEYPAFVMVGAVSSYDRFVEEGWTNFMEVTTVHEVAHQWWQSLVATNEAREPWLDEGFADYATVRYFVERYGLKFDDEEKSRLAPGFLAGRRSAYLRNPDLPMYGTAWEIPYSEYVIAAYAKPDMALMTLEAQLGEETMLEIMQTYFERFRFGHPTTQDFQEVAVEVSGQTLDWFFEDLVYDEGMLNWIARSMEGDTVTVDRVGDIELPVDVLVTFEGGQQELETCEVEATACVLEFPGKTIEAVIVDPERKLMIETDWEDNQLP